MPVYPQRGLHTKGKAVLRTGGTRVVPSRDAEGAMRESLIERLATKMNGSIGARPPG
jgi:hypothetical protein